MRHVQQGFKYYMKKRAKRAKKQVNWLEVAEAILMRTLCSIFGHKFYTPDIAILPPLCSRCYTFDTAAFERAKKVLDNC